MAKARKRKRKPAKRAKRAKRKRKADECRVTTAGWFGRERRVGDALSLGTARQRAHRLDNYRITCWPAKAKSGALPTMWESYDGESVIVTQYRGRGGQAFFEGEPWLCKYDEGEWCGKGATGTWRAPGPECKPIKYSTITGVACKKGK